MCKSSFRAAIIIINGSILTICYCKTMQNKGLLVAERSRSLLHSTGGLRFKSHARPSNFFESQFGIFVDGFAGTWFAKIANSSSLLMNVLDLEEHLDHKLRLKILREWTPLLLSLWSALRQKQDSKKWRRTSRGNIGKHKLWGTMNTWKTGYL